MCEMRLRICLLAGPDAEQLLTMEDVLMAEGPEAMGPDAEAPGAEGPLGEVSAIAPRGGIDLGDAESPGAVAEGSGAVFSAQGVLATLAVAAAGAAVLM
jgi:hypothetical protein